MKTCCNGRADAKLEQDLWSSGNLHEDGDLQSGSPHENGGLQSGSRQSSNRKQRSSKRKRRFRSEGQAVIFAKAEVFEAMKWRSSKKRLSGNQAKMEVFDSK